MTNQKPQPGDLISFSIGEPAQWHREQVTLEKQFEYRLPDGKILYPYREELYAGEWPVRWLRNYEIVARK